MAAIGEVENNQMELKGDMQKIDNCYKAYNKSNTDLMQNSGFDVYQILSYAIQTNNESLQVECIAAFIDAPDWTKFAASVGKITELPKMQAIIKKFPNLNVYMLTILKNCTSVEILEHYQPQMAYFDTDYIKHLCKLEDNTNLLKTMFLKYTPENHQYLIWNEVLTNMNSERLFELCKILYTLNIHMSAANLKKLMSLVLIHEPYIPQILIHNQFEVADLANIGFFSNTKYEKYYDAIMHKLQNQKFRSIDINQSTESALKHLHKQKIQIENDHSWPVYLAITSAISLLLMVITSADKSETWNNPSIVRFLVNIISTMGFYIGCLGSTIGQTILIYCEKHAKTKLNKLD